MKNEQLKKDIIQIAKKENATDITILGGSLFVKFNSPIGGNAHNVDRKLANDLKTKLQTFFDKRKKNDCYVKMSELGNEFAYDFTPIVDFRMEGIL